MLFLPCLGILLRVERLNDLERMELERGRIGGGPSDGLPMCKGFVFTRPERFEYGVNFFFASVSNIPILIIFSRVGTPG